MKNKEEFKIMPDGVYINRNLEEKIKPFLDRREAIAIIGPRQAGKFPRGGATYGATGGADTHYHGATGLLGPSHYHPQTAHSHYLASSYYSPGGERVNVGAFFMPTGGYNAPSYAMGTLGEGQNLNAIYYAYAYTNTDGATNTGYAGTGAVTGNTASASNVPAYMTVVFCSKN